MPERRRSTVRDLRRDNRSVLLSSLYFDQPCSRHDLSEATGLSAASVSNVIRELIDEGIAAEAGSVDSDGGRPRVLLQINADYGYVIGVDVGETRVQVELFDLMMTERAKADYPLDPRQHGPERDRRGDPCRAGRGDGQRGHQARCRPRGRCRRPRHRGDGRAGGARARRSPSAGTRSRWNGCSGRALGLPLHIDNGAKTMGQAELWFGAGRGAQRRSRVPDRLRCWRQHHHRQAHPPRLYLKRRRVGAHDRRGRRARLPVRIARMPGGLCRRRGDPGSIRPRRCRATTRNPRSPLSSAWPRRRQRRQRSWLRPPSTSASASLT